MAIPTQVEIAKQGRAAIQQWRAENPELLLNLRDADLSLADLRDTILTNADLTGEDLTGADLSNTRLVGAKLHHADLNNAHLGNANLSKSILYDTNLTGAILSGACFDNALCFDTVFARVDLSGAKGLEDTDHFGPSTVGIDTLVESGGKIPDSFLRGAGVPDALVSYLPSLLGSMAPIQFYSCFISYSAADEDFAKRLHADLTENGVRSWFAPEDLKVGDRIRKVIDEQIRVYDKLILIFSYASLTSDWVEHEVTEACKAEESRTDDVLFPIRIDDAVMEAEFGWAKRIRQADQDGRHIGDFTKWKNHDAYEVAFKRLMRDLKQSAEPRRE